MTDRDTGQKTPDAAEQTRRFGILPDDITLERFKGVLRIYEEVSGEDMLTNADRGDEEYWLAECGRSLRDWGNSEFRFGSRLTGHSKFKADLRRTADGKRVVEFSFYDNLGRSATDREITDGQIMTEEFRRRTSEYLVAEKVGIPLPDDY